MSLRNENIKLFESMFPSLSSCSLASHATNISAIDWPLSFIISAAAISSAVEAVWCNARHTRSSSRIHPFSILSILWGAVSTHNTYDLYLFLPPCRFYSPVSWSGQTLRPSMMYTIIITIFFLSLGPFEWTQQDDALHSSWPRLMKPTFRG